mgnify:CR=1 FL=1
MKTKHNTSLRIAKRYEYKAGDEQDRLVLGYTKDKRVVYATRGGKIKNRYTQRATCSKDRFSKAIYWRSPDKVSEEMLKSVISITHANTVLNK